MGFSRVEPTGGGEDRGAAWRESSDMIRLFPGENKYQKCLFKRP
jgi:hypothetical protein